MARGPVQVGAGAVGAASARASFGSVTSLGAATGTVGRAGTSIWTTLVTGWVIQLVLNNTTVSQFVRLSVLQLVLYWSTRLVCRTVTANWLVSVLVCQLV